MFCGGKRYPLNAKTLQNTRYKMIEINLLPEELRKRRIELPEISFLPIIIAFLGIVIIAHLLLGLSINLKTKSLRRLEKRWQEVLPDKENADKFKHELTVMRTKIDTIDNLIQSRTSWAKKLSDLSDAMIPSVWLNRLWLEKRVVLQKPEAGESEEGSTEPKRVIVKTLHLNGSVVATGGEGTATIGTFIKSLKNNEEFFADFKEIESAFIQRSQLKDIEVMDFELICYFK